MNHADGKSDRVKLSMSIIRAGFELIEALRLDDALFSAMLISQETTTTVSFVRSSVCRIETMRFGRSVNTMMQSGSQQFLNLMRQKKAKRSNVI